MPLAHVGFLRQSEVPTGVDLMITWTIGGLTEDFNLDMLFPHPSRTRRVVVKNEMKG